MRGAHHKRSIACAVDGLALGERHGAERATVVGALDDDDVLLARRVAGELMDASTASAPEFQKKKLSSDSCGMTGRSFWMSWICGLL